MTQKIKLPIHAPGVIIGVFCLAPFAAAPHQIGRALALDSDQTRHGAVFESRFANR